MPILEEEKKEVIPTGFGPAGTPLSPSYYKLLQQKNPWITGENIQPSVEVPFIEPEEESILPPPVIPKEPKVPPYEATPKEEELSTLIKEITATSGIAGEKEAFRIKREEEAGIEELTKIKQDLTGQLKLLQAEYQQVPLQIQEEFKGRGATVGGVRPIETSRLRNISIKALGVSAMLEAQSGNLQTALDLVERAVNQKYAQAEAERQSKIENLQLLMADPMLTVGQQKRADRQLDEQNAQKEAADKAKAERKEIYQISIQAAQSGVDAVTLNKIINTETVLEATQIAQQAGMYREEEDLLSVAESKSLGVAFGTTRSQAAKMRIIPTKVETAEEATIEQSLVATRGEDGFVDPSAYMSERTKAKMHPTEFDKRFGHLLSPEEKTKLGIAKEVGEPALSKWESEGIVWQWLDTDEAKNLSDEEKASQIRQFGLNPTTFGIYE